MTEQVAFPRVLNGKKIKPGETGVWVDRRSPYGNKFHIGPDGTRDEVCDKYEAWLETQPELKARGRRELRGYNLICHCEPQRCHARTWLRIANEPLDDAMINPY